MPGWIKSAFLFNFLMFEFDLLKISCENENKYNFAFWYAWKTTSYEEVGDIEWV